jgi:hypothetical protein
MLLLLACVAGSVGVGQGPVGVAEPAFGRVLHDFELVLTDEAMDSLRADRFGWVAGTATLDGEVYPAEVRLKSKHGSRRSLDDKPGWKISLGSSEWRGLDDLTLNNQVQDPTALRDHLAYRLYRDLGVPAPRTAWVRLRVNDMPYGLYALVETVDERFLARWYDDPTGALYEGASGTDLFPGREADFEYDEGPEPRDDTALTTLIAALEQAPDDVGIDRLEALVDLEQVLTHLAAESLALHWDGYRNGNNYRLYLNPTDRRFQMLPWGADETFDRVLYDPWGGGGRIARFCLQNPGCAARYEARLGEVADRLDALELDAEAVALERWLRPYVTADPRREYDLARHDEEIAATLDLIRGWPAEVRAMLGEP